MINAVSDDFIVLLVWPSSCDKDYKTLSKLCETTLIKLSIFFIFVPFTCFKRIFIVNGPYRKKVQELYLHPSRWRLSCKKQYLLYLRWFIYHKTDCNPVTTINIRKKEDFESGRANQSFIQYRLTTIVLLFYTF